MSERVQRSVTNHKNGYNCAQAVACAYCDLFGADEKETFKAMEAFGFGMGTMGTCGAVSAMAALAGMKLSDGNLEAPATKKVCYKAMKEMTEQFQKKNKSILCAELKGVESGQMLRSCPGCIEDAARIVEENLLNEAD